MLLKSHKITFYVHQNQIRKVIPKSKIKISITTEHTKIMWTQGKHISRRLTEYQKHLLKSNIYVSITTVSIQKSSELQRSTFSVD